MLVPHRLRTWKKRESYLARLKWNANANAFIRENSRKVISVFATDCSVKFHRISAHAQFGASYNVAQMMQAQIVHVRVDCVLCFYEFGEGRTYRCILFYLVDQSATAAQGLINHRANKIIYNIHLQFMKTDSWLEIFILFKVTKDGIRK